MRIAHLVDFDEMRRQLSLLHKLLALLAQAAPVGLLVLMLGHPMNLQLRLAATPLAALGASVRIGSRVHSSDVTVEQLLEFEGFGAVMVRANEQACFRSCHFIRFLFHFLDHWRQGHFQHLENSTLVQ